MIIRELSSPASRTISRRNVSAANAGTGPSKMRTYDSRLVIKDARVTLCCRFSSAMSANYTSQLPESLVSILSEIPLSYLAAFIFAGIPVLAITLNVLRQLVRDKHQTNNFFTDKILRLSLRTSPSHQSYFTGSQFSVRPPSMVQTLSVSTKSAATRSVASCKTCSDLTTQC